MKSTSPNVLPPLPPLPDLSGASCVGSPLFVGHATEDLPLLRRVCHACPVRQACFDVAIRTHPEFARGIWAGTTSSEREQIRRHLNIEFEHWTSPKLMHALTLEPVTRRPRTNSVGVQSAWDRGPSDEEIEELELRLAA